MIAVLVAAALGVPTQRAAPRLLPTRAAVSDAYLSVAQNHYLPLAAAQFAIVRGTADVLAQQLAQQPQPLDMTHACAMAATGLVVSGAGGATWLRYLEHALGSGTEPRRVMLKVFADLACWAPVVITLNLVSVSLLTGHTFDSALLTAQGNLPHLWGLEGVIFTPYNVCQFSLIPPEHRPSIKACCSFVFSVAFSLSC